MNYKLDMSNSYVKLPKGGLIMKLIRNCGEKNTTFRAIATQLLAFLFIANCFKLWKLQEQFPTEFVEPEGTTERPLC